MRELREELRRLGNMGRSARDVRRSPGRKDSPGKLPHTASAAKLNTFDFTAARDDFATLAGEERKRGGGEADGDAQSVDSISDGEDANVDVDAGVDCGEYELARVGPAGDPTAAVAVLAPQVRRGCCVTVRYQSTVPSLGSLRVACLTPYHATPWTPQGDHTARRILKASKVNSWLRRINRRFSGSVAPCACALGRRHTQVLTMVTCAPLQVQCRTRVAIATRGQEAGPGTVPCPSRACFSALLVRHR